MYVCIYIYICTGAPLWGGWWERYERAQVGPAVQPFVVTDGTGTPDPDPNNLVHWCV